MRNYLIVGIDPGSTVGVALLDFSGKKIATKSFLGGGISEAARFIEQHGTPSLVACDVANAPEMALRLASYFSCKAFCPQKDIREEEKRKIAHGEELSNSHERDAYVAAIFAYRQNANNLRQIDSLPGLHESDKAKIKHLLLKGYRIKDAFLELSEPVLESRHLPKQKLAAQPVEASMEELRSRAATLARENAHLRMLVARLEAEKRQLEGKIRLLENGVRKSVLRDSELRKLRFKLGRMLKRMNDKNNWRKSSKLQTEILPKQREMQEKKETGLNNLAHPVLDLEKIIEEYRRARR
ncbi:MAG: DUF460 domain-containing protein [Candidatus Anstonellaceae archaeon]